MIQLLPANEAFMLVRCDRGIAQEISSYFEFYVPGYQFTPQYKNKLWDGKIRLLDTRNMKLYRGLLEYVKAFCKQRDYALEIDPELEIKNNYSLKEGIDFAASLGLPFVARDYQVQAFVHAIRNKRMLILSPTASGKSLIIYLIMRYFQSIGLKRGLLIVPTTSLCYQMFKDFADYSEHNDEFNVDDNISIIMAGKDKNPRIERIKVTTENNVFYYAPNQKIKTKRGMILAKNLLDSDEIL